MSRAARAIDRSVWFAGLAVAGPRLDRVRCRRPGSRRRLPATVARPLDRRPRPAGRDRRRGLSRVQFPPIPGEPPTGLRGLTDRPSPTPEVPRWRARPIFRAAMEPPPGFAGRSGVERTEPQVSPDFVPIEDRWRIGYPEWDRYGKGHPLLDDYPYVPGRSINPFRQNVLKGDYPILGQHTFFELTGSTLAFFEYRRIPTQTTPFESTARAGEFAFFGRPNQFFYTQFFNLSFDLFHGDAGFKPVDWRIKVTPVFNVNSLATNELAQVDPERHRRDQAEPDLLRPPGVLRRGQAGRHQPQLRLRLGPGRQPALRQRLPRLHLRRHQPGGPDLRHPERQPRPVQPRLLPPVREGHQQRPEHVPRPQPEHLHRQLLPPGLHLPRLHRPGQHPLQQRQPDASRSTRTASSTGPTRSASTSGTRSTRSTSASPATATGTGSTSPTPSTGSSAATA